MPRRASRSVLLISTVLPSSLLRRIAIDPVEGLDVVGLAVAALALLVVALAVGLGGGSERRRAGRHGADAARAQDLATSHCPGFGFHRPVLLVTDAPLTRAARTLAFRFPRTPGRRCRRGRRSPPPRPAPDPRTADRSMAAGGAR